MTTSCFRRICIKILTWLGMPINIDTHNTRAKYNCSDVSQNKFDNDSKRPMTTNPIPNSYCVLTDKIYAGEYPGDLNNPVEKVKSFVNFGITHFIDLTEAGELNVYFHLLPSGCVHYRFPIQDVSIPSSKKKVYELMQYIDNIISHKGNKVYIHCWSGVGRTGTIVGCYYAYKGESYEKAVKHLKENFLQCLKSRKRRSPETIEQLNFIKDFATYCRSNYTSDVNDKTNLERFLQAQNAEYGNYESALREVKKGRKVSHWIWYIFPQLRTLGHSRRALYYGIADRKEAEAYLNHPILSARLREITTALLEHTGKHPESIFGSIDTIKVKSCMTLFDCVSPNDIFAEVLDTFYEGKRDKKSIV